MKQEDINAVKALQPDVIVVAFDEGKTHGIFKKPTRAVLSLMMMKGKNSPFDMVQVALDNCWVEGDDIVKEDVGYAAGLMEHLDALIGTKRGELKN